jgi:hypothetical protein
MAVLLNLMLLMLFTIKKIGWPTILEIDNGKIETQSQNN